MGTDTTTTIILFLFFIHVFLEYSIRTASHLPPPLSMQRSIQEFEIDDRVKGSA